MLVDWAGVPCRCPVEPSPNELFQLRRVIQHDRPSCLCEHPAPEIPLVRVDADGSFHVNPPIPRWAKATG